MEQTAHLVKGGGAAAAYEHEKYARAAAFLGRSLLEGKVTLERVAEAIGRYPAGAGETAVPAFLRAAVEGMNPENCARVLEALQHYRPGGGSAPAVESLRELQRSYRTALEAGRARAGQEEHRALLARLKRRGIGGNAVDEFTPEGAGRWKETKARLAAEFSGELARLKPELARLLEQTE